MTRRFVYTNKKKTGILFLRLFLYPSETRHIFSFGLKSELCSKKAMFNLNENNRFVVSRNPMDLRKGADSLCGAIRSCHLDPLNGDVYVFSNRSRTVLELLHWERVGYTLYL